MRRAYTWHRPDLALGSALVVLAGVVASSAAALPRGAGFFASAQFFPYLIATGLALVGLVIVRGARQPEDSQEAVPRLDGWAVLLIAAGLVAELVLLDTLGWIPAATVLFAAASRAFGERRLWLDILIGLALAGVLFVGFDQGLGLDLPVGSLVENWLDAD
ncbi:tripartite tricarboxylate transporter TctB family protein [Ancylobacter oerskovii]|uniref:Tripartite tricarboxylate transporter TctB family protein n=1 Tax=Ancylobacter oerskovii TaxID=459519 RepID=A0ABW4YWN2_9HYPH|nr:tripartite tricarboxylate transporter TctB family protein [Ancylobacter oerskovii]MBS7542428.1 tripartite tricarboxylate transporter TctB family protein [Ancylobacter oerskovii]